MNAQKYLIDDSGEWTIELIKKLEKVIGEIAEEDFQLDTYPNEIRIITWEQMIGAYSSIGMPVMYPHWSYGKHFIETEKQYRLGHMGLAYEVVINSNPCIAYLMEENTATMQGLVIAHACYGHNSFFKGNYLFKHWTSASSIIDYLLFAKKYVSECEERYGAEEVERILDACHALMNYGVDKYKRPNKLSPKKEAARVQNLIEYYQSDIDPVADTTIQGRAKKRRDERSKNLARFLQDPGLSRDKLSDYIPNENILYFMEKFSPTLEPWQKEVVRIVRKISQYFYPQRQTQVMNEGWATFWHYTILNELYARNLLSEGSMLEFLVSHTNVTHQPRHDSPYYRGINVYALGFAMFTDIRRICESPTEEDREWFPDIAGSEWLQTLQYIMRNFRDESFIRQFLSPTVMRNFRFFVVIDDATEKEYEIGAIHNDKGYKDLRRALADQYELSIQEPRIEITAANMHGDRALSVVHTMHNRKPMNPKTTEDVLDHMHILWGHPIIFRSVNEKGKDELLLRVPEDL